MSAPTLTIELRIHTDHFSDEADPHGAALDALLLLLKDYPATIFALDNTEFPASSPPEPGR
jgi:hypothetical protein